MANFLDEVRETQRKNQPIKLNYDEIAEKLRKKMLEEAMEELKGAIFENAAKNPTAKIINGTAPLYSLNKFKFAAIPCCPDRTRDCYYISNDMKAIHKLVGMTEVTLDYTSGASRSYLLLNPVFRESYDILFGGWGSMSLTYFGQKLLNELSGMCAAEGIRVKFKAGLVKWGSEMLCCPFGEEVDSKYRKGRGWVVAADYSVNL